MTFTWGNSATAEEPEDIPDSKFKKHFDSNGCIEKGLSFQTALKYKPSPPLWHSLKQLKTPMKCNNHISCQQMGLCETVICMNVSEHGLVTACVHKFDAVRMTAVKWCKQNVIAALRISTVDAAGRRAHTRTHSHTHIYPHTLARTGGSQLCQYYTCTSVHSQVHADTGRPT